MYNSEDILARLKNGENIEDISQEIANSLNEAQKKYEESLAEDQKKEEFEKEKLEAAFAIRSAMANYYDLIGKSDIADIIVDKDEKLFLTTLDAIADSFAMLKKLENLEFSKDKDWRDWLLKL